MNTGLPVRAHGLVHIYRTEGVDVAALAGVDLLVDAGQTVALLGPSGSGKSTLMTVCGGLRRPSAGRIYIGDHDLTTMSEKEIDGLRAEHVGLMLQGAARNLIPYLTPLGNVELAQRASRKRGRDVEDPRDILELVGVGSDRATRPLRELTPGFLQLTALAVAVASAPGVLLADEPTSQLHVSSREQVLETIHRINQERGTTVLVVTHDPEVAGSMSRTITIRDGRVGGEGRAGQEFGVVSGDGSLPLPSHVLETVPPGSLVRLEPTDDGHWKLMALKEDE